MGLATSSRGFRSWCRQRRRRSAEVGADPQICARSTDLPQKPGICGRSTDLPQKLRISRDFSRSAADPQISPKSPGSAPDPGISHKSCGSRATFPDLRQIHRSVANLQISPESPASAPDPGISHKSCGSRAAFSRSAPDPRICGRSTDLPQYPGICASFPGSAATSGDLGTSASFTPRTWRSAPLVPQPAGNRPSPGLECPRGVQYTRHHRD